ncbi:MAG TPA: GGDEF domain-containing protein [Longimicrobiales bacterium]|nr:GGDEF domain-containing protein [Longimicrobiales bacterium]
MNLAGRLLRAPRWAVPALLAGAVLLWLLLAGAGGITLGDLLAGAVAAGAGALLMRPGTTALLRRGRRLGGGERRPPGDGRGRPPLPAPDDEVGLLLRRLCAGLGAVRVTLWERDVAEGRLRPLHSSDRLPHSVPATGDPVAWAMDQAQPLRLDRIPAWAAGPVTAAPVHGGLALTAEGESWNPAPAAVADAAAVVGAFVALRERERHAAAHARRFERFLGFLRALPGGAEAERFPDELARALAEISDADGSVVAVWKEERGQVLAAWGTGGGPVPGTYFAVMDGELAMAARAGDIIRRGRTGRAPILAHAGERWTRIPAHLTVVPFPDAAGTTRGVAALWGDAPPDDGALDLVRALAPLLAVQLQHSTELVHFRQRAHEDALTGLRNRAALDECLADERNRFHRYRRPVSLLVIDLDHFKHINDTYGHQAGDLVLERVAEIVRAAIRDADLAFRFGGEELVVLLPETMRREAGEVAERIRHAVGAATIEWGGHTIRVTASIGVSSAPETVEEPDALLKSADDALYASKRGGRNRVTIALPVTSGG